MKVGVVGLGLMGEPIARRLLDAGHELTVFNRTRERTEPLAAAGATVASSPAGVWANATVCITMIADDKALQAVTSGGGGLLRERGDRRVLVDMSTVSVSASRAVASAADAVGVAYLRAPVSGNPSVVRAGNLSIIVSGDEATFRAIEPVLRDIGPNVFYVGASEEARVLKLALNVMIAGTAQLIAEAVVFAEANGLDRAKLLEVMGASAVGSPFVRYKTPALLARDYTTTFSTSMMHKDLRLVLETADAAGVPMPTTALVDQLVRACMSSGMADTDLMALLPHLQRDAGMPPDVTPETGAHPTR